MYISITQDTCPFSKIFLHNIETHCTNTRHTKTHKYNEKNRTKSKKVVNAAELKAQKPFCWLKCNNQTKKLHDPTCQVFMTKINIYGPNDQRKLRILKETNIVLNNRTKIVK